MNFEEYVDQKNINEQGFFPVMHKKLQDLKTKNKKILDLTKKNINNKEIELKCKIIEDELDNLINLYCKLEK